MADRLALFTGGQFADSHAKTAHGILRYGPREVVAVVDDTTAGRVAHEVIPYARRATPIVASIAEAAALGANVLVIGVAPFGGHLTDEWRAALLDAIGAGMHVEAGLHTVLSAEPDLAAAAERAGVELRDLRAAPPGLSVPPAERPDVRVVHTVGSDCAIGKMSVALELRKSAVAAGRSAVFVPTGQTGMMIEGWGVAVDRVISDFVQGTCEWLLEEAEARGDWIIVEGQGSLDHPAYSSVTLGLIHGTTPHALVLVHKPGLTDHDFDHLPERSFPIQPLKPFIALHEQVAALVAPSKVVAVALNTSLITSDDEARAEIARTAGETGLPCDDPVRFGAERLWAGIEAGVEALPWV